MIDLVSHAEWKTAVTKLRIVAGAPSHMILNVGSQYLEEYWAADHPTPPAFPLLLISEDTILPLPKYHYVRLECDSETTVEYEEVGIDIPASDYKYEWRMWKHGRYIPSSPFYLSLNHPVDWIQVIGSPDWNFLRLWLDDTYVFDFVKGGGVWTLSLSPTINFSRVHKARLEYNGSATTDWRVLLRYMNRMIYMNGMLGYRYGS